MSILQIIGTTVGAWLIHATLVIIYIRAFASTVSFAFRAVHATEIFLVMLVAFTLALRSYTGGGTSSLMLVTVGLLTLLVIDVGTFNLVTGWQKYFDVYHFIAAFSAVTLAILVANNMLTK